MANGSRTSSVVSKGRIGVMRMPQVKHIKTVFNNVKFKQYRIVRK